MVNNCKIIHLCTLLCNTHAWQIQHCEFTCYFLNSHTQLPVQFMEMYACFAWLCLFSFVCVKFERIKFQIFDRRKLFELFDTYRYTALLTKFQGQNFQAASSCSGLENVLSHFRCLFSVILRSWRHGYVKIWKGWVYNIRPHRNAIA